MKLKQIFIILIFTFLIVINTEVTATDLTSDIDLYSTAVVAIDANSELIFYEKNKDKKMYPASTTKILTSIIIIENCNLEEKIIISESSISSIPEGYQIANLVAGEEISIKDLLTIFLVYSANDCGYVLADYYAGSIEAFSETMNQTAEKIGCKNSHFVNPSGIHNINHYSTAYDLSLIAKYCMKNDIFKSIVSMPKCTISATNKSEIREYSNTNELLNKNSKFYIEDCLGIKTGYTKDSGNCLISCFSKNNIETICVVLGAPNIDNSYSSRFVDSINLYNFIYSNYSYKTILNKNDIIKTIEIKNASPKNKDLILVAEKDINVLLKSDLTIPEPIVEIKDNITAPIKKNTILGSISYKIDDNIYTCNLVSANYIEQNNFNIYILIIVSIIVAFAIILIFLYFKINRKKYYTDI